MSRAGEGFWRDSSGELHKSTRDFFWSTRANEGAEENISWTTQSDSMHSQMSVAFSFRVQSYKKESGVACTSCISVKGVQHSHCAS
jgi:hypothetical protein